MKTRKHCIHIVPKKDCLLLFCIVLCIIKVKITFNNFAIDINRMPYIIPLYWKCMWSNIIKPIFAKKSKGSTTFVCQPCGKMEQHLKYTYTYLNVAIKINVLLK